MGTGNLKLTICHLYPKLLNLYGDIGNIKALQYRAENRGIEVNLKEVNAGDDIPNADIYFIGGGQDRQQVDVSFELQKHKDFLTKQRDENKVFLAICGGYQLLADYFQPIDGEKLIGISLLSGYTVGGKKRFIGNVTAKTEFTTPETLVGFENHSGRTYLTGSTKPLSHIIVGNGNNGEDLTEGARYKNVFGTYLHGSFLPKNPHFTDYLIKLALNNLSEDFELPPLDDTIEMNAHKSLINKPY